MNFDDMIFINVKSEIKIGDSLCCMPFVVDAAARHGKPVIVCGNVSPLIAPLFRHGLIHFGFFSWLTPKYTLNVEQAFHYANANNMHIAAAHFILQGFEAPKVPLALKMIAEPVHLPGGIVICPFTASDEGGTKLWPFDRWKHVMLHLMTHHGVGRFYILGGPQDSVLPFLGIPGMGQVIPLTGLNLTQVLDVLRRADLFISVDSGPSHLAHFGGVAKHVLLAPSHVSARLAENPRGKIVVGRASDVTVDTMIAAIDEVLAGSSAGVTVRTQPGIEIRNGT
jgi:hypothetical protein